MKIAVWYSPKRDEIVLLSSIGEWTISGQPIFVFTHFDGQEYVINPILVLKRQGFVKIGVL